MSKIFLHVLSFVYWLAQETALRSELENLHLWVFRQFCRICPESVLRGLADLYDEPVLKDLIYGERWRRTKGVLDWVGIIHKVPVELRYRILEELVDELPHSTRLNAENSVTLVRAFPWYGPAFSKLLGRINEWMNPESLENILVLTDEQLWEISMNAPFDPVYSHIFLSRWLLRQRSITSVLARAISDRFPILWGELREYWRERVAVRE